MKHYNYKISSATKELFFPKKRIKSKLQIINILLEATRYILSYQEVDSQYVEGELRMVIDKMSRLFFSVGKKSYSIVFPFKVILNGSIPEFQTTNNLRLDSYLISKLISVINCHEFNDKCVLSFADSVFEYENSDEEVWEVIKELMLFEDGYIRYDHDPSSFEKAKTEGVPHRHPLDHYDLFYTHKATFKIGLEASILIEELIDFINVKTDCQYLKRYSNNP